MVICLSVHCWVGYIWFGWHGAVVPNKYILISIHLKYSNYKFIFVRTLWLLPLDTITIATSILALLLLLPSISTSSAIMHCINISISDIHYPNINFQNTEWTIDGILGYGGVTERSGTGRTNDWKRDDQRMLWNCNWESISLPSAGIISSEWLLVVMKFEIYRTHPIMNWVSGNTHWWLYTLWLCISLSWGTLPLVWLLPEWEVLPQLILSQKWYTNEFKNRVH